MAAKPSKVAPPPPEEKAPAFKGKLPKSLAACADQLYLVRQKRLALKKEVEAMEAEEAALREHLINNLPKSAATGIAGKIARASIESKDVFQAKDWDEVHAFIVKNHKKNPGVWALMQRRLGTEACKEMYTAGKAIPGVERIEVPVVSLNKL